MRVDEQQRTTTAEVVSSSPVERHRSALTWWLIGGLALALVVVAGLGSWLYTDHHQTESERAAMTAVTAYLDAANANDRPALNAATTDDVVWTAFGLGAVGSGPYVGQAYLDFQTGWGSFTLEPTGDPLISGDQQVAQVLTLNLVDASGLIRVTDQVGVTVFRLADEGGRLKVSEIIWMPYDLK